MKNSIKFFSLLTILFLFSIHCSATKTIESKESFVDFKITTDLIGAKPCLSDDGQEIQGYSATIRVNLHVVVGGTQYLVASQIVKIPCGTVINHMTRSGFDDVATSQGSDGVSLITDYLNENDEDDIMFNAIKKALIDAMNAINE